MTGLMNMTDDLEILGGYLIYAVLFIRGYLLLPEDEAA
jgi:hypothetical protein